MARSSPKETRLRRKRRQMVKGIDAGGELLKCSLIERFTVCTKPGCRCGQGDKHGPYLYVSIFDGKQSRQIYVPQSMEKEVRLWAGNYRQLSENVAKISQLSVELIRLQHRKGR